MTSEGLGEMFEDEIGDPPTPALCYIWVDKWGYFQKFS